MPARRGSSSPVATLIQIVSVFHRHGPADGNREELADLARDADLLRPLHLGQECSSFAREDSRGSDDVLRCEYSAGRAVRFFFDGSSGLLTRQESGPAASVVTSQFEDYRSVDGVQIPFRTRIRVPGATIIYSAERVRQNAPIDERVFRRPDR